MTTTWWQSDFAQLPYSTWFWVHIDAKPHFPEGDYWIQRIPADDAHREQLAYWTPVDIYSGSNVYFKANTLYILTDRKDTPNWGGTSNFVQIAAPCGNWGFFNYQSNEQERNQTYGSRAAVLGTRESIISIKALLVMMGEIACSVASSIQSTRDAETDICAAVLATREITYPIRAAIRVQRSLTSGTKAAVARDFSISYDINAAVQGSPRIIYGQRTAIRGEAQATIRMTAMVMKSRVNTIYLEMENLWPQELDLRSTPNWPSRVKDYRKDSLGE